MIKEVAEDILLTKAEALAHGVARSDFLFISAARRIRHRFDNSRNQSWLWQILLCW